VHILSISDSKLVNGAEGAAFLSRVYSMDPMLRYAADYSFTFALLGSVASGIYGHITNQVTQTNVGNTIVFENSAPGVFFTGIGLSWATGLMVGLFLGSKAEGT
jgi:hypothetical protein